VSLRERYVYVSFDMVGIPKSEEDFEMIDSFLFEQENITITNPHTRNIRFIIIFLVVHI
jgi:hypothetical protein